MGQHDLIIIAYTSILLLSIGITIGAGIYTLRRRRVAGARSFGIVLILEASWTIGFLFEAFANQLPEKIFWDNLQWIATLFAPLAMLSFALEYSGRKLRHTSRSWVVLTAIPVLTLLLIYTNSWHGLAIQAIQLVQKDPFPEYTYQFGALLWAGMIYDYAITLMALSFLIGLANTYKGVYRLQTLIIITGLLVPILGTFLTLLGIKIWEFRDSSPITFAISNLLIAVGLFRYRIFDLLPLARDLVVENMEDGVIVLDPLKRLVDINRGAKLLVGQPHINLTGQPLAALALPWLQPGDMEPGMAPVRREVNLPGSVDGKALDLRISCINRAEGVFTGYLIILRDISDHKRLDIMQQVAYAEMEYQVAERTAQLSNTVNRLEEEINQRRATEDALLSKSENLDAISYLAIMLADVATEQEIIAISARFIKEVTGSLGCIVSIFDPQTNLLSVKYIATPGQLLKKVNRLLPDLLNLRMPVTPEIRQGMMARIVGKHTSISEITFGALPENLGRRLLKLLKIGEMVSITLHAENELFGTIMLFLPQEAPSPAVDLLDAFSYIISVTLRRSLAEEALRASEVRFRTLLENSNDLISVLDPHGKQLFTYNVDSQNRVLGYPPEKMMEKNLNEFIHPDDLPRAREIMARILEKPGNHEVFEMRYQHMDGSWITLETYAKNLLHNPLIRGIVSTSRDVTERVRAEEEQRSLNRTLAMIGACNQALVRMDDEFLLLETICHVIVETGGHYFAWINYLQEKPVRRLFPAVFYGAQDDPFGPVLNSVAESSSWEGGPGAPPEISAERQQMEADLLKRLSLAQPIVVNDVRSFNFPAHRADAVQQGIQSMIVLPLIFGGEIYGGLHIHSRALNAFDDKEVDLLTGLAQDVSFGIHALRMRSSRDQAEQEARLANDELNQAYESTLEGWSRALELRERETAGHSQRVVEMTLALANQMGFTGDDCIHIRRGALLHDIGKMGVPDTILMKPDKLTPEDWAIMRKHPAFARDLLYGIPYLGPSLIIPYCHHERWDGSGYPLGLKGEEIPLPARIFAVVDVWDALGWDRPYRKAWPQKDILQYLAENAGVLFDPQVVQLFLAMVNQMQEKMSVV